MLNIHEEMIFRQQKHAISVKPKHTHNTLIYGHRSSFFATRLYLSNIGKPQSTHLHHQVTRDRVVIASSSLRRIIVVEGCLCLVDAVQQVAVQFKSHRCENRDSVRFLEIKNETRENSSNYLITYCSICLKSFCLPFLRIETIDK